MCWCAHHSTILEVRGNCAMFSLPFNDQVGSRNQTHITRIAEKADLPSESSCQPRDINFYLLLFLQLQEIVKEHI